ncbi:hypothetical protein PVK06_010567 [Gossypium arboreum]|uniref:Uncharacterized protein n=1 Tax=Gossypium arboreum TaxID=29729 RepID=A0ABR0Q746_GOSAR|nr:hypothetical protein PVK06_010567 [Gossypium arboreum]
MMKTKGLTDEWTMQAFIAGAVHEHLKYALINDHQPERLSTLFEKAHKYAETKELQGANIQLFKFYVEPSLESYNSSHREGEMVGSGINNESKLKELHITGSSQAFREDKARDKQLLKGVINVIVENN